MRVLRRRLCVWGFLIALNSVGDAAFALPHWTPKPAGPTTVYAPRVRHFIVVDPVAAPAAALMPTPVAMSVPIAPAPADKFSAPAAAAPVDAAAAAVSAPVSSPRKGERLKKALSPVQTQNIFWQQRVEPVPAYPWGWFGARRHTSNIGHRRYYGGQYDSSLLRGD